MALLLRARTSTSHQRWSTRGCRDDAWPRHGHRAKRHRKTHTNWHTSVLQIKTGGSQLPGCPAQFGTSCRGKQQHPWPPREGTPCSTHTKPSLLPCSLFNSPAQRTPPAPLAETSSSFERKLLLKKQHPASLCARRLLTTPHTPQASAVTFAAKLTRSQDGCAGLAAQPSLGRLQPAQPSHRCPRASRPCSKTEAVTERPTTSKEGNQGSALTRAAALASPRQQPQLAPIQEAKRLGYSA